MLKNFGKQHDLETLTPPLDASPVSENMEDLMANLGKDNIEIDSIRTSTNFQDFKSDERISEFAHLKIPQKVQNRRPPNSATNNRSKALVKKQEELKQKLQANQ